MSVEMPNSVPSQRELWDKKHAHGEHEGFRANPTPFAEAVREYLPEEGSILEIGCGVGSDAAFFAQSGREMLATDLSSVVIVQNKAHFQQENLRFERLDVSQSPLPFDDGEFDAVYSHLALHYYDDEGTKAVFTELHRVLKSGGVLAFACKSVEDPKYGIGEDVGKDMFLAKGHLRHFFSASYVEELLRGKFEIEILQNKQDEYSRASSAFVWCVATKQTEQ